MGRLEKKYGVSPTTGCLLLLMLLMWQGHVLASTIFPSYSEIGVRQDSSSSWDFDDDDTETSKGEYANFFSEDNNMLSFKDAHDASKTSATNNKEADHTANSFEGVQSSSKSSSDKNEWPVEKDLTERFTLPHGKYFHRVRPLAPATLAKEAHIRDKTHHETASTSVTQLGIEQSRFERRKSETTAIPGYPIGGATSVPSHATHNNGHYRSIDDVSRNDVKGVQAETRRFVYSTNKKTEKATDSNRTRATMDSYSATGSISEAAKNQNGHGTNVSGQRNNSGLQFKFRDRIPFPYVRRGNDEDRYKRARMKPQNMNEGRRSTDPRQRYYYSVNGETRLQRKNRSKRDTLQTLFEEAKRLAEEEIETGRRIEDHGETHKHFEGSQQHKSSERSVVGNNGVRSDEVTETNVRDNTTSRPPPPPSNPVEVLQRLTRLLDRMLRELSMFGQKFTLRLIRMTERQDIDQMQEIMKDFDISPQKPIFFIAGGLRKLNENVITRVGPSPIAATPNLTENMAIVINETVEDETTTEIPVLNTTEDEEQAVPDFVSGSTMVPILRPSGISSLPVESDSEETTVAPSSEQESELDIPDATVDGESNTPVDSINVTTLLDSSSQHPLLTRRKRESPDIDEFIFLPIPGRSARTENPYDDEEEFYQSYNYPAEPSEDAEEAIVNEEDLDYPYAKHLTSFVSVRENNSTSNIPSLNNIPVGIEVIDQSQSKKNDEISSNDSNTIIGHVSSASAETTSALLLARKTEVPTSSPVVSVSSLLTALNGTTTTNTSPVPPSDSIKIKEQGLENPGSNDHHQGEQNIHRMQTNNNNAIASTPGESNIRHVEEYPPTEKLLKTEVAAENIDGDEPNYASPYVSTDQRISSIIPNLESNKTNSPFEDKNVKADTNILSSLHEPLTETQQKVALDIGNKLEINKFPSSPVPVALESADGSSELLFERKEVGHESKVVAPALPNEILQNEKRSFHSNSAGGTSKQNIAEKVVLDEVILTKVEPVESGNRQLLSSEPNDGQDSGFGVSSFNDGVVSENERNIASPPTQSTPAVRHPLFADNASTASLVVSNSRDVSTVPVREDSVIPALLSTEIRASSSEKETAEADLRAPHRVTLISKPQESNHNDPQEEIKAASLLPPQANTLILESGINIPVVGVAPIKEILPTPNNAEKVSLTSENVPTLQVQQRTISKPTTSINNIELLQEHISMQADPIRVDPLLQSSVAPHFIKTEESNAPVDVAVVEPINPAKVPLVGESSVDEEQAVGNKQQTFTLGENQATLVGQQNVVDEDMKKVVEDEEEDKIERGKVQVSPNQANLPAPTVLKVSKIIGNNNATFLPADKTPIANVIPIHSADHVVVRGTGTVELPDSASPVERKSTDKIGTTVRNTEQVSVQNSKSHDASGTQENKDGSIAAPIVSDNGEVRNPIAISISQAPATGKENFDILPENNIVKENLSPILTSQEPSNVGSIMLSPEIAVPFVESSGTTVTEDRLNVGTSSKDISQVLPVLDASSSTIDLNFQDEKIPVPENDGIKPLIVQEVKPSEVNILPDVKAVNDLSKIVRDVPKVETTKIEVLPAKVSKANASPVNAPVDIISSNVNAPVSAPQTPVIVEKDPIPEPVKLVAADVSPEDQKYPVVQVLPELLSRDKIMKVSQDNTKVKGMVNPNSDIVKINPLDVGASEIVDIKKQVNGDLIDSSSTVVLPNQEVEMVNSLTIAEPKEVAIKNEDATLIETLKKPASTILSTSTAPNLVETVPLVSESTVAPVKNPSVDATLKETPNASALQSSLPILPAEASVSNPIVDNPKHTPVAVVTDPVVVPVLKQGSAEAVVPASIVTPNLTQKTSQAVASEPVVVSLARPVEVIDSNPLVLKGVQELLIPSPVLKEAPQVISSISSVDETNKPIPEAAIPQPVSLAQPVASPPFINIDSTNPAQPGNENIIASLPEINPDSAFGVKPIDTQPHFQIPGLRPSIPERPHPDYLGFISQGVDVDSLIFSPPTTPVVITSPPVFSGYSPTAILRKQEQMMKHYFNGLLIRRALPV